MKIIPPRPNQGKPKGGWRPRKHKPPTEAQRHAFGGAQAWVKVIRCACGQEFKTVKQINRHQVEKHGVKLTTPARVP